MAPSRLIDTNLTGNVVIAFATAVAVGTVLATLTAQLGPPTRTPRNVTGTATYRGSPSTPRHVAWIRQASQHLSIAHQRERRSDRSAISTDLVAAWADHLARQLRAGATLRAALTDPSPQPPVLARRTLPIRRNIDQGSSVAAAVTRSLNDPRRPSDPALNLLWSVIAAAADFGGSAAGPLDRVAAALRMRSADRQERAAQSAQARLSAHVLTVVPIAVLALMALTDPDVRHLLVTAHGCAIVLVGLALNLAGWFWMRRVVTDQERSSL